MVEGVHQHFYGEPEASRGTFVATAPLTQANLLLIGQWLDLFNHQGSRTTPLKDLAAGGDLLASKRQQPFVLPRRRRGVGNRPVDG